MGVAGSVAAARRAKRHRVGVLRLTRPSLDLRTTPRSPVTAELFASDLGDPIPPFPSAEYVPEIWPRSGQPKSTEPATGPAGHLFGRVTVQAADGRTITLEILIEGALRFSRRTWYIRGGPLVPARVFGEREGDQYYISENFTLADALREMGEERTDGRKRSRITFHLDELERSSGRRPPLRDLREIPE